ncbi:Cof-type HAD-IIB family hydrolase [Mycoplasma sp. 'Moose RK']|uniref:Cof-type HAD-IIB family hydrolase n=1 Tax=Mycoplasma sp. 'Moose RK' TaxID=2780095 RepID=UPI0018C294E9|nr:Cof-type HAD-IIB family hydrolase [Mycoplasma sp. 'Moose RK']MBG0730859.1 Cof-type HAD-IIB family hydrolase [Mycoplasma sp. 'Moose RK']
MNGKKLVFSDIDGTLYCANFQISEETASFIKENKDKLILVLNTGNPLASRIKKLAKTLEIRYLLTSNGALFSDLELNSHQLVNGEIDFESQKQIFAIAKNLDLQLNFWNQSHYFAFNAKKENNGFFDYPHLEGEKEVIFTDSYQKNIIKMELIGEQHKLEKALKKLGENPNLESILIKNLSIEISKKGTNKGNGLQFVSAFFGFNHDEVMAIGDSPNDISMLNVAGFSYAMANGSFSVKKVAKFHTSSCNQEGVVMAIRDFFYRTKFK